MITRLVLMYKEPTRLKAKTVRRNGEKQALVISYQASQLESIKTESRN